ncbi:MAG: putative solute-binding protein [Alcanivoracaceae bacterium]|nr:putative solute-binding protein [Alcanivoracaceae bacterium]
MLKKIIALLPLFMLAAATDAAPTDEQLRATAYDQSLSREERIAAIRQLYDYPEGKMIKRNICIWDIAGRSGPIFAAAQDQRSQIMQYGVDVEMIPYTNETVVAEDLKSGICDAALMTGLRARLFHRYSGTIDAVGAVPDEKHMYVLLQAINSTRNASKMVSGEYVVLGIAPAGAAYVFVNDRSISSLAKAAGKKVAVLDYDKVQAEMVAQVGATPILSDIVSAPNKFNNGVVDVLPAPLVAYEVLELYKGMSPNGGIVRFPLAQITMQVIGRTEKFPNELAQLVREVFLENYDLIMTRLGEETSKVPAHWWIDIPERDQREYEIMMQQARLHLREREYYDPEMLTLQRKVRCKFDASRSECVNPEE